MPSSAATHETKPRQARRHYARSGTHLFLQRRIKVEFLCSLVSPERRIQKSHKNVIPLETWIDRSEFLQAPHHESRSDQQGYAERHLNHDESPAQLSLSVVTGLASSASLERRSGVHASDAKCRR